jgi:RNA polymerase sigma factor (TIGR02999 family)
MGKPEPGEVTRLLLSWSRGDSRARDQLMPLVYGELRRLAAGYLKRERSNHTLQPTGLVHEAYLRLVDQSQLECRNRAEFFGIAANLMRQILVNHAKRHQAARHGGGVKVALEEAVALVGQPELDLLALDHALEKLAQLDPRQCRIVEMRFFAGLTEEEIAAVLEVSPNTVKRDWRTARMMLHNELCSGGLD